VVPENTCIHAPTTERIRNFGGGRVSKVQEIPEGRGVGLSFQMSFVSIWIQVDLSYLINLNPIILEIHFLSSKSTLEANKYKECAVVGKLPPVTSPHGLNLWMEKQSSGD